VDILRGFFVCVVLLLVFSIYSSLYSMFMKKFLGFIFVCATFFSVEILFEDTKHYTFAQEMVFGERNPDFVGGASNFISDIQRYSDTQFIISGGFTEFNGQEKRYIARINADGSLDNTFDAGAGVNSTAWTTLAQSDGKILVGGFFTNFYGTGQDKIGRLNADGSLDEAFDTGLGINQANTWVYTFAEQGDGKILVGGAFSVFNNENKSGLVRLNPDGSLDNTFNVEGVGFNQAVWDMAVQPDGKILAVGGFTNYNGVARNRIARLNPDGSLDETFNIGTGANFGPVYAVALQEDGKVLVGGSFTQINGSPRSTIARLNADGSVDQDFVVGTGFNQIVRDVKIQPDGKVLVVGNFTSYNGTPRVRMARLNSDGSLDETFEVGTGFNGNVLRSIFTNDGDAIVVGQFTSYDAEEASYIVKVSAFINEVVEIVEEIVRSGSSRIRPGSSVIFCGPTRTQFCSPRPMFGGFEQPKEEFVPVATFSDIANACDRNRIVVSEPIRPFSGESGDTVLLIQDFLNTFQGERVNQTGVYDSQTVDAVRRFQERYRNDVLDPWGLGEPTGIVYKTTSAKMNALMCTELVCPVFSQELSLGDRGAEVQKVKLFLNTVFGANLDTSNDIFDQSMFDVVTDFQSIYSKTMFGFWGRPLSSRGKWDSATFNQAERLLGCGVENDDVLMKRLQIQIRNLLQAISL